MPGRKTLAERRECRFGGFHGFVALGLLLFHLSFTGRLLGQQPVSSELVVGPPGRGSNKSPAVAVDGTGAAVVVWNRTGSSPVVLRILDTDGSLSEMEEIAPGDAVFTTRPTVALNPLGEGVVAWQGPFEACEACMGARVLSQGGVRLGSLEPIGFGDAGDGTEPRGDIDPGGNIVFAWKKILSPNLRAVWTRAFAAGLEPLGDALWLADAEASEELETTADVAALERGSRMVVWNSAGAYEEGQAVLGRVCDAHGSEGPVFKVNAYAFGDQQRPTVASNGFDRVVVAWDGSGGDGSVNGVLARLLDLRGQPLSPEIVVSSEVFRSPAARADVAMDPDGNFLVVYEGSATLVDPQAGIRLRAFKRDGTPIGDSIRIDQELRNDVFDPAVATSASGLVAVVWRRFQYAGAGPAGGHSDIAARHLVLPCLPGPHTLCLGDNGRFLVRAFYESHDGSRGHGRSNPWTRDSGGLSFFGAGNLELAVKVLDACAVDGTHWVFAAGLTDVRATLVVTDTWSGATRALRGEKGEPFAPGRIVGAIGACDLEQPSGVAAGEPSSARTSLEEIAPASEALLLHGGRVRLSASWRRADGTSGTARAVRTSDGGGLFWFFSPGNPELAVKLLDGCAANGHLWLFAAGLTDVEVELRAVDQVTGTTRIYRGSQGVPFVPVQDTAAFASCP